MKMILKVKDHGYYAGFKININGNAHVGWNIEYQQNILYFGGSRKAANTIARRLKIGRVV